MRSSIHTQLALGAAIVVAIAIPVAAGATDSGKVGRLAFGLIAADGNTDIYSVMPDGSEQRRLTTARTGRATVSGCRCRTR